MTLNKLQYQDFNQSINKMAYLMTTYDINDLDLTGVENRIQQAIGVLNLINHLELEDASAKKIVLNIIQKLYNRKKELQYGYQDDLDLKKNHSQIKENSHKNEFLQSVNY